MTAGQSVSRTPDWVRVFQDIHDHGESFGDSLRALDHERKLQVLGDLSSAFAAAMFQTAELHEQVFTLAETQGLHVLRPHFYSPVPTTSELSRELFQATVERECGVDFRLEQQRSLLPELGEFATDFSDVPTEDVPGRYHWRNPAFPPYDATVLFAMIRKHQPRNVVEVGSGYSTLVSERALAANKLSTTVSAELVCIEPYPLDFLRDLTSVRLIEKKVQDVDLELFSSLRAGDILFIDSTHVSKLGSDVNHLLLRVLPRLARGVLVHFHDIFLPFEYPEFWLRKLHHFWNEQYMLMAFLSMNRRFRVEVGTHYWVRRELEFLRGCFPNVPEDEKAVGGSFWLTSVK